jgi:hypothetical protein
MLSGTIQGGQSQILLESWRKIFATKVEQTPHLTGEVELEQRAILARGNSAKLFSPFTICNRRNNDF